MVSYRYYNKIHRVDGPAVHYGPGTIAEYWINGEEMSKNQFQEWYLMTNLKEYDDSNELKDFSAVD